MPLLPPDMILHFDLIVSCTKLQTALVVKLNVKHRYSNTWSAQAYKIAVELLAVGVTQKYHIMTVIFTKTIGDA